MGNLIGLPPPPPPPRYPGIPGGAPGVMIPPPPGPPPGSALPQQAPWHGTFGRMYDGRPGYAIPPPPPGQHQPYNPKMHAFAQNANLPPPPPPQQQNHGVSATYIPSGGDTYGEGVGIPGFGFDEPALTMSSQASWPVQTPLSGTDTNATTPMDDAAASRERLYPGQGQTRGLSNDSNAAGPSTIPPEIAAQWPMDTVLIWLAKNQFSGDWQETFKALGLHGTQFLELGGYGGRGNLGIMHQQVYPRLARVSSDSGTGWDQLKEREEGKRLRRLIKGIVTGKPVNTSKTVSSSHGRKESGAGSAHGTSLPSAGTDPADSPNVSANICQMLFCLLTIRRRHSIPPALASQLGDSHRLEQRLCLR